MKRIILNVMDQMLPTVEQILTDTVEGGKFSEKDAWELRLVLVEAITNSIRHGNREDPSKLVMVQYQVTEGKCEVTIADQGQGFDPLKVPDPTLSENLDKLGGRGILLMQTYSGEVRYNAKGNEVYICKEKPHGGV